MENLNVAGIFMGVKYQKLVEPEESPEESRLSTTRAEATALAETGVDGIN